MKYKFKITGNKELYNFSVTNEDENFYNSVDCNLLEVEVEAGSIREAQRLVYKGLKFE